MPRARPNASALRKGRTIVATSAAERRAGSGAEQPPHGTRPSRPDARRGTLLDNPEVEPVLDRVGVLVGGDGPPGPQAVFDPIGPRPRLTGLGLRSCTAFGVGAVREDPPLAAPGPGPVLGRLLRSAGW